MKRGFLVSCIVCQAVMVMLCSIIWAQQLPGQVQPGAIEKSLEPVPFKEPAKIPDLFIQDEQDKKTEAGSDIEFTLKDVSFRGNRAISGSELRSLIENYIGKTIKISTLQEITSIITNYYKKSGFILSRAYIPPQTIKDSVIIAIREGSLGKIIVNGNKRYSEKLIQKTLDIIYERGAVNLEDVERALLLLMDVPGLGVKATFKPGSEPGTTDLVIDVTEERPIKFGLDYNNYGTEYISEHRFGATASVYNLTGIGDALSVRGVIGNEGSDALLFGKVEFMTPIDYRGMRLGAYYQYLDYELQDIFEPLEYSGTSATAGIWLSYPVIRTRNLSWWLDTGIDIRDQKIEIVGEEIGKEKVRPFYFGTTLQKNDSYKGSNYLRVKVSRNQSGMFWGTKNSEADLIRLDSEFNFTKLSAEYFRYQRLPGHLGLMLTLGGQITGDRLPSSEQISMGGFGTVRGYDQSEYAADSGGYANLELRIPLYGTQNVRLGSGKSLFDCFQFAAFIDAGTFAINDTISETEDDWDGSTMIGAGVGIRFDYSPYIQLSADWAISIGGEDPIDPDVDDKGIWYFRANVAY